jgi:hypothetical protein
LSPATSRIADRHGSKPNKTRMFVYRGRSSFRFASVEPAKVSTSGRPSVGPYSASTSTAASTFSAA